MASEDWEFVGKGAAVIVALGALGAGAKVGYDAIYEAGELSGMRKQEEVLSGSDRLIPQYDCMRYDSSTKNANGNILFVFFTALKAVREQNSGTFWYKKALQVKLLLLEKVKLPFTKKKHIFQLLILRHQWMLQEMGIMQLLLSKIIK